MDGKEWYSAQAMINIKNQLYEHCQEHLREKKKNLEMEIRSLQSLANEETKSSAGDKYETTRAMIHLEMEKLTMQLTELARQKAVLDVINATKLHDRAQPGSIVVTDRGHYFLSISAGSVHLDGKDFICISASSPIGIRLSKLKSGDAFSFNKTDYRISAIY
jgi:transcription elongation GreA/GreB family factor